MYGSNTLGPMKTKKGKIKYSVCFQKHLRDKCAVHFLAFSQSPFLDQDCTLKSSDIFNCALINPTEDVRF